MKLNTKSPKSELKSMSLVKQALFSANKKSQKENNPASAMRQSNNLKEFESLYELREQLVTKLASRSPKAFSPSHTKTISCFKPSSVLNQGRN
jgi:hypothetical protein